MAVVSLIFHNKTTPERSVTMLTYELSFKFNMWLKEACFAKVIKHARTLCCWFLSELLRLVSIHGAVLWRKHAQCATSKIRWGAETSWLVAAQRNKLVSVGADVINYE